MPVIEGAKAIGVGRLVKGDGGQRLVSRLTVSSAATAFHEQNQSAELPLDVLGLLQFERIAGAADYGDFTGPLAHEEFELLHGRALCGEVGLRLGRTQNCYEQQDDKAGAGIVDHARDGGGASGGDLLSLSIVGRDAPAKVERAGGIDDGAVAGGVVVQIGVRVALDSGEFGRMIGVRARDAPIADQVLHEQIAILERFPVVDRSEGDALAVKNLILHIRNLIANRFLVFSESERELRSHTQFGETTLASPVTGLDANFRRAYFQHELKPAPSRPSSHQTIANILSAIDPESKVHIGRGNWTNHTMTPSIETRPDCAYWKYRTE